MCTHKRRKCEAGVYKLAVISREDLQGSEGNCELSRSNIITGPGVYRYIITPASVTVAIEILRLT